MEQESSPKTFDVDIASVKIGLLMVLASLLFGIGFSSWSLSGTKRGP